MQKLRSIASSIATLGPIGYLPFAGLFAAALAIPVVYCMDMLIWAMHALYPGVYMILLLFISGVIIFASFGQGGERPSRNSLVIANVYGMLLVFSGIAINIKFVITGYVLFVLISYALPRLLMRFARIDCATWPLLFGVLFIECTAGLLVNFLFRFVFWLVTMPG